MEDNGAVLGPSSKTKVCCCQVEGLRTGVLGLELSPSISVISSQIGNSWAAFSEVNRLGTGRAAGAERLSPEARPLGRGTGIAFDGVGESKTCWRLCASLPDGFESWGARGGEGLPNFFDNLFESEFSVSEELTRNTSKLFGR